MQIHYAVFGEKFTEESTFSYMTYGIEVWEEGRIIRRIRDVTLNESEANDFAKLCTRLKLSPEQLDDAIYDLLCTI